MLVKHPQVVRCVEYLDFMPEYFMHFSLTHALELLVLFNMSNFAITKESYDIKKESYIFENKDLTFEIVKHAYPNFLSKWYSVSRGCNLCVIQSVLSDPRARAKTFIDIYSNKGNRKSDSKMVLSIFHAYKLRESFWSVLLLNHVCMSTNRIGLIKLLQEVSSEILYQYEFSKMWMITLGYCLRDQVCLFSKDEATLFQKTIPVYDKNLLKNTFETRLHFTHFLAKHKINLKLHDFFEKAYDVDEFHNIEGDITYALVPDDRLTGANLVEGVLLLHLLCMHEDIRIFARVLKIMLLLTLYSELNPDNGIIIEIFKLLGSSLIERGEKIEIINTRIGDTFVQLKERMPETFVSNK